MRNIARALVKSGWSVNVLSPQSDLNGNSLELDGVSYHFFNYKNPTKSRTKLLNSVRGAGKYKRITNKLDLDIVLDDVSHLPFYPAHFTSPPGVKNVIFLHTAHYETIQQYKSPPQSTVLKTVERTLPWLNDPHIVCAGPGTEDTVNSKIGYNKTSVVNPSIDLEDYSYQFEPDSKQIMYLGRLTERKNVSCLLRAWKDVERKYTEATLRIAGKGPKKEELMNETKHLGLENVVYEGYVSEQKKIALLQDSLAMVIPSYIEGYVTTGLEAMASGTLVIGSKTNGIQDYVTDEVTGRLFDVDSPESLSKKLCETLSDPSEAKEIIHEARATAERHSINAFPEKVDKTFSNILSEEIN